MNMEPQITSQELVLRVRRAFGLGYNHGYDDAVSDMKAMIERNEPKSWSVTSSNGSCENKKK